MAEGSDLGADASIQGDLRELIEVTQDLVCLAGTDGYLKWVNPAWTDTLGWSAEELTSRPYIDFVHAADLKRTDQEAESVAEGNDSLRFENRYRTKDGGWKWLSWNAVPREDGTLFCVVRDVTDTHNERFAQQTRIRQLELAESLLQVGNWRVDLKREKLHWSPMVYRIHGRDPATYEPELETAIEAYHRADRDEVRRHLDKAIRDRAPFSFVLRLVRADTREERLVRSSGTVQSDEDGEAAEIIGVFQDITELTNRERQLRETNAKLERRMSELEERSMMMQTMSELGDMLQSALDIEESKEVLRALLPRIFRGLSGVLYVKDPETTQHVRVAAWGPQQGAWRRSDPSGCWAVRRGTTHAVRRDGVLRCRHLDGVRGGSRCVPLMAHGQLVGLLVLAAGSEREELHLEALGSFPSTVADQIALAVSNVRLRDRLRQQSLKDQLTGLYNRRFFDDWLDKHISHAGRVGGSFSVAMLDLDHFKRFNDTYGHFTADRLLTAFANVLRTHVRAGDVVCRWGGEEFLIAMPDCSGEDMEAAVGRIQSSLSQVRILDEEGGVVVPATLSSGVATYPAHGHEAAALLHAADQALYAAKDRGRNTIVRVDDLETKGKEEAA